MRADVPLARAWLASIGPAAESRRAERPSLVTRDGTGAGGSFVRSSEPSDPNVV